MYLVFLSFFEAKQRFNLLEDTSATGAFQRRQFICIKLRSSKSETVVSPEAHLALWWMSPRSKVWTISIILEVQARSLAVNMFWAIDIKSMTLLHLKQQCDVSAYLSHMNKEKEASSYLIWANPIWLETRQNGRGLLQPNLNWLFNSS